MRTLEQIEQEYRRVSDILSWEAVTEESLLELPFPDDVNFVQFTGRMNNRFVRGRLTRDRSGTVSVNIDHTMLACNLNDAIRALHTEAGEVYLANNS